MLNNFSEKIAAVVLVAIITALLLLQWLPLVNGIGLLGAAGLAGVVRREGLNLKLKVGLLLLLVPLAFWVATFRPEGFNYPLLLSLPGAEGQSARYELFVNFAKALVGFTLLYLLWPKLREGEFVARARYSFLVALLAPVLIVALAIPVLGLYLQPKTIEQMVLFGLGNLLIVCVAEEAFLRFLLQQPLRNAIAGMTANRGVQELIPLLLVTAIFVAIHSGIGGAAIWVYALAGFLYGLSYTLSKNICYPIMIHFFVNQIHFSFLTYPL